MRTKIADINSECTVSFFRNELNKLINKYYIGNEECCEIAGSKIVLKSNLPEGLITAHNNLCTNHSVLILADLMSDGRIENFRVKENNNGRD